MAAKNNRSFKNKDRQKIENSKERKQNKHKELPDKRNKRKKNINYMKQNSDKF